MLYPTLSQPLVFLCLILAGLIGGLVYELALIVTKICGNGRFTKQIMLFVATIMCAVLFFVVNLSVNYGEFRIYALLTYVFTIILEWIILGKFFAILSQKCYNVLNGRKQKKKNN